VFVTDLGAVEAGKTDPYAQAVGGMIVVQMSSGSFDYFPAGQPPHAGGEVDRDATLLGDFRYVGGRWVERDYEALVVE
jgi:hypothetical protein